MKIVESALERYSLPPEAVGAGRVILSGNNHLSVENHRGILEFSEDFLVIALKKGRIFVKGQGLSVSAMDRRGIVVCGKIVGIDLE